MSRTHDHRRLDAGPPLQRQRHDDRRALQAQLRAVQLQAAAQGAQSAQNRSVRATPLQTPASTAPLSSAMSASVRNYCNRANAEYPSDALQELMRRVDTYITGDGNRNRSAATGSIGTVWAYIEQGALGFDMRFTAGVNLTVQPVAAQQREHRSKVNSQSGSKDTRVSKTTNVNERTDETSVTGNRKDSLRVGGEATPREGTKVQGGAENSTEHGVVRREGTKVGTTAESASTNERSTDHSVSIDDSVMHEETEEIVHASWWWRVETTTAWGSIGTTGGSEAGQTQLGHRRYSAARPGASSNPAEPSGGGE